ncbi:response regulator [Candidatus Omnitrophota bacterium]
MNKPRILSVDDEPSFVDMLKQYFEIRGYVIDVTSEGEEGLRLLSLGKYDVVLLDLKMAGLSGDKIMDEIKKQKLDTKIIFISAYSDSGKTKERLMNEGAYAFLEKPITSLKELEDLVNEAAVSGE